MSQGVIVLPNRPLSDDDLRKTVTQVSNALQSPAGTPARIIPTGAQKSVKLGTPQSAAFSVITYLNTGPGVVTVNGIVNGLSGWSISPHGWLSFYSDGSKWWRIGGTENTPLSQATADYALAIGEKAVVNFSDATSIPLHIACADGMVFDITIDEAFVAGTAGAVADWTLRPNNTAPTGDCTGRYIILGNGATTPVGNQSATLGGLVIGSGYTKSHGTLYTDTTAKFSVFGPYQGNLGSGPYFSTYAVVATNWNDTTTPYTSVGTVYAPQQSNGKIIVERTA